MKLLAFVGWAFVVIDIGWIFSLQNDNMKLTDRLNDRIAKTDKCLDGWEKTTAKWTTCLETLEKLVPKPEPTKLGALSTDVKVDPDTSTNDSVFRFQSEVNEDFQIRSIQWDDDKAPTFYIHCHDEAIIGDLVFVRYEGDEGFKVDAKDFCRTL